MTNAPKGGLSQSLEVELGVTRRCQPSHATKEEDPRYHISRQVQKEWTSNNWRMGNREVADRACLDCMIT